MTNSRSYEGELLGALEYAPVQLLSLSLPPENATSAANHAVSLVTEEGTVANHNCHNPVVALKDTDLLP
jgi:hypothetical protein